MTSGNFRHCVAGMHLGSMEQKPTIEDIDAVLTVATDPGTVGDDVRHRHLPISYQNPDIAACAVGMEWVRNQISYDRRVLVRSEGGRNRPALIVGGVVLMLGGTYNDAFSALLNADPWALGDFRYKSLLREFDDEFNGQNSAP